MTVVFEDALRTVPAMHRSLRALTASIVVVASAIGALPAAASATAAPAAPDVPVVGTVAATSISFSWSAPSDTGGSRITGYDVMRDDVKIARTTSRLYTFGGLTGGSTYAISVRACNLFGCSADSVAVSQQTAPAPVTALKLETVDAGLKVTWTDSTNAATSTTGIWYRASTSSTWIEWTPGSVDASGDTITGLTNGATYAVRVRATASYGVTDSATALATPLAAPAAATLGYSSISHTGVILNWTTPTGTAAAAKTYEVYRDGTKIATVGTKHFAVTNLTPLATYAFTVKSCNTVGCSAASNALSLDLPPSPPSQLAVSVAAYAVTLSWTDSSAEVPHSVWYKLASAQTWTEVTPSVDDASPTEISGLTGGMIYNFRVGAHGESGIATYSTVVSTTPFGTPVAPVSIRQTLAGPTSATVAWTAPFNGGSAITGYKVFVDGELVASPAHNARTAALTGLTAGSRHSVAMQACNAVGCSAMSASTVVFTTPDAPSDLVVTPGPTSAVLTWVDSPSQEAHGYKVFFRKAGVSSWTEYTPQDNDISGMTLAGLNVVTSYEVFVRAYNPGGFSNTATSTFTTSNFSAPSSPQAPTGVAALSAVRLTWNPPTSTGGAPVTDYIVEFSANAGSTWATFARTPSAATTANVTGLTAGTSYLFRVSAKTVAGTSDPSGVSASITPIAAPAAPTALSAVRGAAQVVVSWTAPVLTDGSTISDYVVQYSSNGGTYWVTFADGESSEATATVSGLKNGTAYVFRVAGVNGAGVGAYSTASAPSTPMASPTAPPQVSGTPGVGEVRVAWTIPASNGGALITDYAVEFSSNGGTTWVPFNDAVTAVTTTVVTGLTNGTAYMFRVAAVTAFGTGEFSAPSALVTPRTTPGAPSDVTATAGNASVALSWTAPAVTGGAAVTDYIISFSSNGGVTWRIASDGTSTATTATVTGLANGTTYTFRVAAANGAGAGSHSAVSSAVTPFTVPGAPVSLTAVSGKNSMTLSWRAPAATGGAPIIDYVVQYSVASPLAWVTLPDGIATTTSATATGLTDGVSYVFRVFAVNSAGSGPSTTPTAPTEVLNIAAAPTGLTATVGAGSAELTWEAPSTEDALHITDYLVQVSANGGTTWTTVNDGFGTTRTVSINNLVNGTGYVFRVAALSPGGTGEFATTTSPLTPLSAASAPTALTATAGNTSVALAWKAPASNGGAAITDYVISVSIDAGTSWLPLTHLPLTTPSFQVTGLTNGTSYIFKVAAVTSFGVGAATSPTAAVTPRTVSSAPTALTATALTTGRIALSWTAPTDNGGSPVTDYQIQRSSNAGVSWSTIVDGFSSATTYTAAAMVLGSEYMFRVAAVSAVGPSAWSAATPAVRALALAGIPTSARAAVGDLSATVSWSAPLATGGTPVTDYTIQFSSNNGATWTTFTRNASTVRSVAVTGLANGTAYRFRVAAVTDRKSVV